MKHVKGIYEPQVVLYFTWKYTPKTLSCYIQTNSAATACSVTWAFHVYKVYGVYTHSESPASDVSESKNKQNTCGFAKYFMLNAC